MRARDTGYAEVVSESFGVSVDDYSAAVAFLRHRVGAIHEWYNPVVRENLVFYVWGGRVDLYVNPGNFKLFDSEAAAVVAVAPIL